jgi:pullulanase/glycogen debranching enzyme
LGWQVGDLAVIANAWWEPLTFALPPGPWRRVVDTSLAPPGDIVSAGVPVTALSYDIGPRATVILERPV